LIVQTLLFFWNREGRISGMFVLFGGMVLMFVGDERVNRVEYVVYQISVIAFLLCMAGVASSQRIDKSPKHRLVRTGKTLTLLLWALSLPLIVGTSFGLYNFENELNTAFANLAYDFGDYAGVRMTSESQLGSVAKTKLEGKTKVALRVISGEAPGYLRANAYDNYEPPRWLNSTPKYVAVEVDEDVASSGFKRYPVPALSPRMVNRESLVMREIWPDSDIGKTLFTQLHMPFLEYRSKVLINSHGIATTRIGGSAVVHRLQIDSEQPSNNPNPALLNRLTDLPVSIDPEVVALAEEIFEGADSTMEKVHRVITHFQVNHEYTLGITIPPDTDPLTYFLLERPPAHCEYFASGAAILLRLGGVPCRYVTGYVAREQNTDGGYWLARSRDAHAWVEVWDEEQGWVTVEATPASGVPQGEEVTDESYAWDAWKLWFQQWKDALFSRTLLDKLNETMQGVGDWLAKYVFTPTGLIGMVMLALAYVMREKIFKWRRIRNEVSIPLDTLGELLARMDAWVDQQGCARMRGETLLRFSERLLSEDGLRLSNREAIAQWYETYSNTRYDPEADNDRVALLLAKEYDSLTAEALAVSTKTG
jgi:protein-glutamine gamma-glutamyltransferase